MIVMKKILFPIIVLVCMGRLALAQNPGDLDFSFNGTGYHVRTDSIESRYEDVFLLPDGKILAGGVLEQADGPRLIVDRYLPDGEVDTTWGVGGRFILTTMDATSSDWVLMDLQPDGKPVVSAVVDYFGVMYNLVMRLHPDGTPDSTFGQVGYVLDPTSNQFEYCFEIKVLPTGKILLLGGGESALSMVTLESDGNRDTGFGLNGIASVNWPGFSDFSPLTGHITPSGEAFVIMEEDVWSPRYIVVSLDDRCELDSAFGTNGRYIIPQSHIGGYPMALHEDGSGRVYLAGMSGTFTTNYVEATVIRLQPSGVLDATFGSNGQMRLVQPGADLYVNRMMEQVDGKLLVCGVAEGSAQSMFVGRFTPAGQVDLGFGQSGVATPYIGGTYAEAVSMAQQADGKIVLAGMKNLQFQEGYATVVRLEGGTVIASTEIPVAEGNLTLYPNPSAGQVKLLLGDWTEPAEVQVMDMAGREILCGLWTPGQASSLELDLGQVPEGSYLVRVVGVERVAVGRLVRRKDER